MSKTKQYYTDQVEKQVDEITDKYVNNQITEDQATKDIENIDNVELVLDKNNIDEWLYYAKQ